MKVRLVCKISQSSLLHKISSSKLKLVFQYLSLDIGTSSRSTPLMSGKESVAALYTIAGGKICSGLPFLSNKGSGQGSFVAISTSGGAGHYGAGLPFLSSLRRGRRTDKPRVPFLWVLTVALCGRALDIART